MQSIVGSVLNVFTKSFFYFISPQLSTGEVWVQYNDGSQMIVQSSVTSIKYTDSRGTVTRYISM